MRHDVPLVLRFLSKLVLDILPAALASVIGGFLLTQYQFGYGSEPKPKLVQVTPASEEMMRLVRDEHAAIVDFLKAQTEAEKTRRAAEREEARALAEAATAPLPPPAPRRLADAATAEKAPARRNKVHLAARPIAPQTPLPIVTPVETSESGPVVAEPVRESNSLIAKTVEIKDNVVAGTRKVVAAIGAIPSWFVSMGERIGGNAPTSDGGRFVSTL
jgi:hypothetical protein